jgi:hypothetical protein
LEQVRGAVRGRVGGGVGRCGPRVVGRADAALDYALAAARLWSGAAEGAGLARLQHSYPAFESAVGEDVHRLDTDRLVVAEVRAGYGCSQLAASAKLGFAEFLRDIPAVADALATG